MNNLIETKPKPVPYPVAPSPRPEPAEDRPAAPNWNEAEGTVAARNRAKEIQKNERAAEERARAVAEAAMFKND